MSSQASLLGFFKRPSQTVTQSSPDTDHAAKKRKIKAEDERFRKYENVSLPTGYYAVRNSLITNDIDHLLSVDSNSKSAKIAAFDFDNTMVNRTFGQDPSFPRDLTHPAIPLQLLRLHQKGYRIVIFTNEATIGMRKRSETIKNAIDKKVRGIEKFIAHVQATIQANDGEATATAHKLYPDLIVPIYVLIATRKDMYRKPNSKDIIRDKKSGGTGMWSYFCKAGSYLSSPPATKDSFFVGDAAGRLSDYKQSDGDKQFAERVGLRFFNEVEFWMQGKVSAFTGAKDSDLNIVTRHNCTRPQIAWRRRSELQSDSKSKPANQSIVLILHGLPGSGKSTFASKIAKGSECGQWVIVCQDVLGSKKKCEEKFKHALLQRCNIIVDRTNYSCLQREWWLQKASSAGAMIILVDFDVYHVSQLVERCMRRTHVGGLDGHNRSASQIKDVILRLEKTYDKPDFGVYFSVVHCKNDSFSDKYANNFASGLVPVVHTNKIKSNKSEVVEIKNEPWEDINKRDQIILNALRSKKMSPEDLFSSCVANGGNASSGNSKA